MIDKKAIYKLTHGMYVCATNNAACFVDAVCQISGGENPLVSVAVMKKNYTNEVLHNSDKFSISIFGENDDMEIVKNFGFHSQRDYDKFEANMTEQISDVPVVKGTIGYLILEKVDMIENDTHTLFIGKVIEASKLKDDKPMSYNYYQEHKDELLKVKTENNKTAWVCNVCGYVYYGDELPENYKCPLCGVGPENFTKNNN